MILKNEEEKSQWKKANEANGRVLFKRQYKNMIALANCVPFKHHISVSVIMLSFFLQTLILFCLPDGTASFFDSLTIAFPF